MVQDEHEQGDKGLIDVLPGMFYRGRPDAQRTMSFVSAGCLKLTGYKPEELTGHGAYGRLIHADDWAAAGQAVEVAVGQEQPYDCVYRLIAAGGQIRWVRDKGQAIAAGADGQVTLAGFVTDATEETLGRQRLEQELADRSRKLSILYDILEPSSKSSELQPVLVQSLKRIIAATGARAGFIHLRDKSGKTLRLVAQRGLSSTMSSKLSSVPAQNGLFAQILQEKQSLLIMDVDQDPRATILAEGRLKVYAGAPIARGRRVWGALSLLSQDGSQIDGEHIALLVFIGEGMGIVVENARLRRRAEGLLVVQERNRLARELHDSVTQSLYSLTLFAEAGRRKAQAGRYEETTEYLAQIGETGQQALKEMRLLVHRLRPPILAKEGLARALQHRLNAVEGRAGVRHQLFILGKVSLSQVQEETLYLVAQEALNNSLKHAMATEVVVRLSLLDGGQIALEIEDNGRGFDLEQAADSDGLGLISMQERVEKLAGHLTIESIPGEGTLVKVVLADSGPAPGRPRHFGIEDLP